MDDVLRAGAERELRSLLDGLLSTFGHPEALAQREHLVEEYTQRLLRLLDDQEPDPSNAVPEAVELLTGLGVDPLVAERLAAECPIEEIEDWIAYASACRGLTNPAGLVVSRLRRGVPAPRTPVTDSSRYVSGEYAAYIQH